MVQPVYEAIHLFEQAKLSLPTPNFPTRGLFIDVLDHSYMLLKEKAAEDFDFDFDFFL
jgi:hypothetical protein